MHTVLHKLDSLITAPSFFVSGIAITIHIRRTGAYNEENCERALCDETQTRHTANSPRLTEQATAKRNIIHTRSNLLVPACDDDTRAQSVLVLVAYALKERSCGVHRWWPTSHLPVSRWMLDNMIFQA